MSTPKIIADFETQLATAIAVEATSFTLGSATDDDGVALPTGLYYFTINNGSSNKEYLAGTLTGTSVTSVVSVSRQGVETSGANNSHRVGDTVLLTDWMTYKKYMDEIAVAGASDASATVKGVVEVATTAEVNAGTGTGGTGAALSTAPDALAASNYGILLASLSGAITAYGGTTAPTGFLLCDGSAVSRTTYSDLFAVISTAYGVGDGSTTFNLPDLKGNVPVGYDAGQTEFDAMGETGGAKTHTLIEAEIPAHTHDGARVDAPDTSSGIATQDDGESLLTETSSYGGGGAHNNLQPYVVVNYIIKT